MSLARCIQLLTAAAANFGAVGSIETHMIIAEEYDTTFSYQADLGPFRRTGDTQVVLPVEATLSNLWGDGLDNSVKNMIQDPPDRSIGANYGIIGVGGEPLSTMPEVPDQDIFDMVSSEWHLRGYVLAGVALQIRAPQRVGVDLWALPTQTPAMSVPTGTVGCFHISNPLNSTLLPLNTAMRWKSVNIYRDPHHALVRFGEMILSVNDGGRLVADMVFDMQVKHPLKPYSDADGPSNSTVWFTGSLQALPPGLAFEKKAYTSFPDMSCEAMPEQFPRPGPDVDVESLNAGVVQRTSESMPIEEELTVVRAALRCWGFSRAARKYGGAFSSIAATAHGFHEVYLHPQDLQHFSFDSDTEESSSNQAHSTFGVGTAGVSIWCVAFALFWF